MISFLLCLALLIIGYFVYGKIVDSVVSVSENTNRVSELSGNGVDGAVMIYDTIQDFSDTIGRLHGKVEKLQDTISNEQ